MRAGSIFNARDYRAASTYFDWARKPVGTGPYRIAEYVAETRLVLEAFDDYWGGRPPIRSIRFVEVPELAARIAGLLSGDFDFACDITPDQIDTIQASPRAEVLGGVITNQRVLMMDTNHPQLRDVRIRQALSHSIDRQAIIDTIWGGRTQPSHGLQFAFYGPMFLQDWTVPAYDPALARDLLKQAGYKGERIPYKLVNNYYTN
jgi:peptide/nickel transport system substrate-binding protein